MPKNHLKWLQAVLDRFALNGLKLKPLKCHFFKDSLTYLGHEISAAGMLPGQEGIQKIAEMGYPKTVTGVRKFIGATGYFRRFIKNYARITEPLNNLIGCDNAKLKNHPVTLSPEAKDAFNILKTKVYDCTCVGLCRFGEALPVGNRRFSPGPWCCPTTSAGRWKAASCRLRQPCTQERRKELLLIEIGVFGTEVGSNGTIQVISVLQAIYGEDG